MLCYSVRNQPHHGTMGQRSYVPIMDQGKKTVPIETKMDEETGAGDGVMAAVVAAGAEVEVHIKVEVDIKGAPFLL